MNRESLRFGLILIGLSLSTAPFPDRWVPFFAYLSGSIITYAALIPQLFGDKRSASK